MKMREILISLSTWFNEKYRSPKSTLTSQKYGMNPSIKNTSVSTRL